jgi:hypothetical protein
MFFLFFLSCIVVLLISLFLAMLTKRKYNLGINSSIYDYLFGYNTIAKAAISNVGSILSVTTILGVVIGSVISNGPESIVFQVLAIISGYFLFALIVKLIFKRRNQYLSILENSKSKRHCITIIGLVDKKAQALFKISQVSLYILFLLVEFIIVKMLLKAMFPNSESLIYVTLFVLTFMCATYVSVGGFVGVLNTDIFQLITFIAASSLIFILAHTDFSQTISTAYQNASLSISDIKMYPGFFLFMLLYCFAWPDLWVRNIGSLGYKNKFSIPSISWALLGIAFVIFPCFIAAIILRGSAEPTELIPLPKIMEIVVNPLSNNTFFLSSPLATLMIIVAGFCMFITTVDTWLLGVSQHLFYNSKDTPINIVRLLPFMVSGVVWSISYFIDYSPLFYLLGLLMSQILLGNFVVLLMSGTNGVLNILNDSTLSWYWFLILYYLSGLAAIPAFLLLFKPMKENIGTMLIIQFVLAFIFLIVIPNFVKYMRARKA